MARCSYMKISDHLEIFLFPETSPESFLIDLIEKYGSVELGIAIASNSSSERMIEAMKSVTNGFLVLNAIYLDKQMIRLPNASEKESLEKAWQMPLRWLSHPVTVTMEECDSLSSSLESLLKKHKIKAFLMDDGHALILNQLKSNAYDRPEMFMSDRSIPSFATI